MMEFIATNGKLHSVNLGLDWFLLAHLFCIGDILPPVLQDLMLVHKVYCVGPFDLTTNSLCQLSAKQF
jgi:hypothetical protein